MESWEFVEFRSVGRLWPAGGTQGMWHPGWVFASLMLLFYFGLLVWRQKCPVSMFDPLGCDMKIM